MSSPLTVTTDEGWIDLSLGIHKIELFETTTVISARSSHENVDIGLDLSLMNAGWDKQPIDGSDQFLYWGKGAFLNVDNTTENFLSVIAQLYKVKKTKISNKQDVPVDIVGLTTDPTLIETQPTKMKIFFNSESKDQSCYGEIFVNVDPIQMHLEFNEKDIAYRQAIITSLAGTSVIAGKGESPSSSGGKMKKSPNSPPRIRGWS